MIPTFVSDRIRRPATHPCISLNSTPVPFFGNVEKAKVATLSLNPSHQEFHDKNGLHPSWNKRLESLVSLGADSLETLSDEQIAKVFDNCRNYFGLQGRPYMQWFGSINKLLIDSIGVSYMDGSCCHLDIVQWATNPKWDGLAEACREEMLATDLPFLKQLIVHYDIDTILLNGRTTVDNFLKLFEDNLSEPSVTEDSYAMAGKQTKRLCFYQGVVTIGNSKIKYLGWNIYLQRGIRSDVRQGLSEKLKTFR